MNGIDPSNLDIKWIGIGRITADLKLGLHPLEQPVCDRLGISYLLEALLTLEILHKLREREVIRQLLVIDKPSSLDGVLDDLVTMVGLEVILLGRGAEQ